MLSSGSYLHINEFIHRDIKAANLLIDDDGTVLLGDLGVAASLSEDPYTSFSTSKHLPTIVSTNPNATAPPAAQTQKRSLNFREPLSHKITKRKSFVGTPCWMAPELILGRQYDASADIWSFGITALELAQGRPPRSRESPKKVLVQV